MGGNQSVNGIPAKDQTPPGKHVWLGYLEKRGHCRRNWKSRYFIFDGKLQKMCYFKDEEQIMALGEAAIANAEPCDLYDPNGLELISKGGKVYYIKPGTRAQRDQLLALLAVRRQIKKRTRGESREMGAPRNFGTSFW